jgi:hypothetical protein
MPKSEERKIYTKFMMIGYEIPTAKPDPGTEYALDFEKGITKYRGQTYTKTNYLHIPEMSNTDAKIRLQRLAGVVNLAKSSIPGVNQANVLKIFMAPEFFFRPKDEITQQYNFIFENELKSRMISLRAYTEETRDEICNALATMFSHKDFADWVFIPGSIVYGHKVESKDPLDKKDPDKLFLRNQAMVVIGGKAEDAVVTTVDKVNISKADGVYDPGWRQDCTLGEAIGGLTERKKALFMIHGIKFGLEICMDHDEETLKKTCQELVPTLQGGLPEPVDLHLLINNSQILNPFAVAARQRGYVLREDGSSSPETYEPFTEIGRVTRLSWKDSKAARNKGSSKQTTPPETTVTPKAPLWSYFANSRQIMIPKELKINAGTTMRGESMDKVHPQYIVWSRPIDLPR